jgi:glycosyltransferase involved in cell wall biosynthesis
MKQLGLIQDVYNTEISFNREFLHGKFDSAMEDKEFRTDLQSQMTYLIKEKNLKPVVVQLFYSEWGLAFIKFCHFFRVPVITEIDDDIYHVPGTNASYDTYMKNPKIKQIIEEQLYQSDAVFVSTNRLKEVYEKYNRRVYVVPNGIDFDKWCYETDHSKKDRVTIGFSGGAGHAEDLQLIVPAIKQILDKYPQVDFKFIGGSFIDELKLDRVEHIEKFVPIEEYPKFRSSFNFDIEIAPLVDSYFSRGKSNLRYLEAGATKTPLVASNVEAYRNTKATLCSTTAEWVDSISALVENYDLRRLKGEEAYEDVQKRFSMNRLASYYFKLLKRVNKYAEGSIQRVEKRNNIQNRNPEEVKRLNVNY